MEKTIRIGQKEVNFKATASTTRRYRDKFGRDLLVDLNALLPGMQNGEVTANDLEIFENLAYIMAKQGDDTVPNDPSQWLDQFELMEIYNALPELMSLWGANVQTIEKPKKKADQQSEN